MKRIIALLLALVLVLALTACGTPSDKEPAGENPQEQSDSAPEAADTDNGEKEPVEATPDADSDFDESIMETLLVDEQGIKITATEFVKDGAYGPELKLTIENNSGKNLTFQTRHASVNNYMIDALMSTKVADGERTDAEVIFAPDSLEAAGIEHFADIEMSFYTFDSDTWETYFESDLITIRTADGELYDYTYDDSGDVVLDNDTVKIVIKGHAKEDSVLGPGILVYIENKGENSIIVQTGDATVNGIKIDPLFASEVGVGKHAVDTVTIMSSDLEENGITEIETLELSFKVYNYGNLADIAETDPVTVNF